MPTNSKGCLNRTLRTCTLDTGMEAFLSELTTSATDAHGDLKEYLLIKYDEFGETMTPKKRMIKAVKHEEPDRVPVVNTLTTASAQKVSNALHLPYKRINNWHFNDQLVALGNDAILVGADAPKDFRSFVFDDGSYSDEWGIRYKRIGVHEEMIKHPLRDIENLDQ